MSAVTRFFRLGAEDADRRVAAALAPVRTDEVDRYLKSSRIVAAIDRGTLRLRDWWHASATGQTVAIARERVRQTPPPARYQGIGSALLVAVIAHVALTLMQGPRPGWFWLVIPLMAAAFAALLLAGSRSSKRTE